MASSIQPITTLLLSSPSAAYRPSASVNSDAALVWWSPTRAAQPSRWIAYASARASPSTRASARQRISRLIASGRSPCSTAM